MKLKIITSEPTVTSWKTLPKKLEAILTALNKTPHATWEVEVQYKPYQPVLDDRKRIDHGWYNTISYPLFRQGYHLVYLHMSTQQWNDRGLDQGIRGANQIDTDFVGESYGWSDEHTERGDTGENQFIQNVLHECSHQLARDTGTADLTHSYHDQYPDISPVFMRYDMRNWQPEYLKGLKAQVGLLQRILAALTLKQAYGRPLPNHWTLVTQTWMNSDPVNYPRTGVHVGTDFMAPVGTPILAPADGTITRAGYTEQLGNWVEFKFGSRYLVALHLRSKPQPVAVRKGTPIGYIGQTGKIDGIHAHLELWKQPMNRALLTSAAEVRRLTEDITKVIP